MKNLRVLTALIAPLILILPFQNCSLQESEGKKFMSELSTEDFLNGRLETNEKPSSTASQLAPDMSSQGQVQHHCGPYLDKPTLDSVFGQEVDAKLFYRPDIDELSCLLSVREGSESPLDTAVCSISTENLSLFLEAEEHEKLKDPSVEGELSGGSFGYLKKTSSTSRLQLVFLGAHRHQLEAIACFYSFADDSELEGHLEKALGRSSQLVHRMATQTQ